MTLVFVYIGESIARFRLPARTYSSGGLAVVCLPWELYRKREHRKYRAKTSGVAYFGVALW